jgi:hypothetical protein
VIGSASTLTAEQARRAANEILARASLGHDPANEREESRSGVTVSELADAFLADQVEAKRKASTLGQYRFVLENLVKPKIGNAR